MKRLIAITALGLAISFPSLSLASDHMNLYTKPVAKSEVRSEKRGGDVEKDFTSFYISPKSAGTSTISGSKPDDDYVSAFGVRIAR